MPNFLTSYFWDISSVGLERCLDRAEVTGSNPVYPTLHVRLTFIISEIALHQLPLENGKSFNRIINVNIYSSSTAN